MDLQLDESPLGQGVDRILTTWKALARHADTPCEACQGLVQVLRLGRAVLHVHPWPPPQVLDACCGSGQGLAAAWMDACTDVVEHLIAVSGA